MTSLTSEPYILLLPNWGVRCLGLAPRAQLLKTNFWLLRLIGDKVPPVTRVSNEAARALS